MKLNIRKGDTVQVIAGGDKGKKGSVLEVNPAAMKIKIENVKVQTHYDKKDGLLKKEGFIDYSNVKLVEKAAKATKEKYAANLANHHKAAGWSFLIGTESNIQQITKATGFNYTFDAKHNRYNHAAAAIFISPKGRITRYLYEVGFNPETLKMALVEAGEGKIGSSLDAFVLWCYHYDANENRYSANAKTILSVTAGLFLAVGIIVSLPFWISWRRDGATISHSINPPVPTTINESTSLSK